MSKVPPGTKVTPGTRGEPLAYVTRPHEWRISVARGTKTLWEKISSGVVKWHTVNLVVFGYYKQA